MMNYDNFDFSPYLIVNDIGRPLLPPQRLFTKEMQGKHGAYFFDKEHGPIILPVSVTIHEDLDMSYMEMKRFIAGNLNKKEPKRLIFEDEPDRYIEGIIQDETEINDLLEAGSTVLNFFCPDPFYYAIDDEVFSYNNAGTFNFSRSKGNEESEPLIEIEGTNNGGIITLATDNTEINFDGVLRSGEILVFDSSFITSYVEQTDGVIRSANDDIDTMDFPIFPVGANKLIVSVQGKANVTAVRIYAKSRWI